MFVFQGFSIEEAMRLLEEQGTAQLLTNGSQNLGEPGELNLNTSQLEQEIEAMIQNAEKFSQQQQQQSQVRMNWYSLD